MLPLPKTSYEPVAWFTAKVQNDYLISDGINKYSVPFDLIGEPVDIGLASATVEVFYYGGRVAAHVRKAAEKYGNSRIEKSCEKLLTVTAQPSLRSIITILKNGKDNLKTNSEFSNQTCHKRSNGITRGFSAYRNGGGTE